MLPRILLITSVVALLLAVWYVRESVLWAFAGILFSIFLRSLANWVSHHTGLGQTPSLLGVILALIGVGAGFIWLVWPDLSDQLGQLTQALSRSFTRLKDQLVRVPFLKGIPFENVLQQAGQLLSGAIGTVTGVVTGLVLILFLGLFLAFRPNLYLKGLFRLIPPEYRGRAHEVLAELYHVLRRWLMGRIFSMVATGILTGLGLWFLGVPIALSLGVLAGALEFIPYLGPVFSAIPAILYASAHGSVSVWAVLGLFAIVQLVESYVLTPLVQHRAISILPAVLIIVLVALSQVFGFLGLLLGTPLAAVAYVLIEMLYIKGRLHEVPNLPGRKGSAPAQRSA